MRIGIDCRTILNPGFGEGAGIGHYTYYLVHHLLGTDQDNKYILFFDKRLTPEAALQLTEQNPQAEFRFFPFHRYKHFLPFAYSHLLLTSFVARELLDLYHLPAGTLPLTYSGDTVLTVHDCAIFRHPEWFPRQLLSTKISFPQTLKRASKIIAVSEFTKKELCELFNLPSKKIKVVYEGVDIGEGSKPLTDIFSRRDVVDLDDLKQKYGLSKNYILFLGTIEPRKNVGGLVRAFGGLLDTFKDCAPDLQLVLGGSRGWRSKPIFQEIKKAEQKTKGAVRYLGYVPHQEKLPLIQHAACFVFPSFYEGFGLPVLESMALGTPVVCSDIPALKELTQESALLVPPGNEEELAKALKTLLLNQSLQLKLIKKGKERAAQFNWQKTAVETRRVYESAV